MGSNPTHTSRLICGINSKVEYQVVALIMLVRFQHVTPNYIVRWLSWFKVLDWKSSVSRNGGRGFEPHSHCQINSMMAERLKALISKISNLKRFMGSNPIHASKKKRTFSGSLFVIAILKFKLISIIVVLKLFFNCS